MRIALSAITMALLIFDSVAALGQSPRRYSGHEAWAVYHINDLAPDIRANVLSFKRECGSPLAATHAFLRPTKPKARFVALHYEAFWCQKRKGGICQANRCLHEVYERRDGNRYRLIFRAYEDEVEIDPDGGIVVRQPGD